MPRRVKELTDMEIDEISLVDRPANEHARVVIAKSDSGDDGIYDEEGDLIDEETLEEGDVVFDSDGQAFVVVEDVEPEMVQKSDEYYDFIEFAKSESDITDEDIELLEDALDKPFDEITVEDLNDILEEDVEKASLSAFKPSNLRGTAGMIGQAYGPQIKSAAQKVKNFATDPKKMTATAGAVGGAVGIAAGARHVLRGGKQANKVKNAGSGVLNTMRRHKVATGLTAGAGLAGGGYLMHNRNVQKSEEAYDEIQKSFSEELREELAKSMTDSDRDEIIAKAMGQVEEMQESLLEAEEIAKSERLLRLTREYEEVAKSYNLPVEPSELAPVLYAIAEYLPYEHGEIIHKALSAAGEIIYEEIGVEGNSNNDVLTAVDDFISENVSKADISKASAVAAVFDDNPDAYDEYMATRYGS